MFGLEVGNYIHPKEYTKITTPVPMDVPRIRYEFGRGALATVRLARCRSEPVGIAAGTITLNGSGSYDP